MKNYEKNFVCDEAHWLGNEIALLAGNTRVPEETTERLRHLAEALGNAVFAEKEVSLPLSKTDELEFVRDFCREENPILSANPAASAPLIFDETTDADNPTLYFKKQFCEERFIAKTICEAADAPEKSSTDAQKKIIAAGEKDGFGFALSDEQQRAVEKILRRRFSIISGGPGTGKTSLLLRALVCILDENPDAVIEIAAPTGKAAARIRESVTKQIAGIELSNAAKLAGKSVFKKISEITPKTLHRLLAISPAKPRPSSIAADVVIVDEASMISQNLMATLLRALPENAKLVLLGDKNQLDSVQPGHVFGDFYNAPAIAHSRAELTRSHRFRQENFIGRLANCVLEGANTKISALLAEPPPDAVQIEHCREDDSRGQIERILTETLPQALRFPPPDAEPNMLLEALESSRILTPTAEGLFGKNAINAIACRLFSSARPDEHFHGRPILVTQNAPEFSLSNGDIGIILRSPENRSFYAWFLNENGEPRRLPTAFLPNHETAYAMTVHKSQGSEFSRLSLFFPKALHAGFHTRQLLYTAITRFKETPQSRFVLCFDPEAVKNAVSNISQSRSLLPARLWETKAGK